VSATDCAIRQGLWWGLTKVPFPITPGVDVVGRIYRVDTETNKKYGWKVGDRIVSLVKWGGNARYVSLDPSHAVAAPETIDPAMAVCIVETYLTAFQVLHMGQANDLRYCDGSLSGKSILLRGLSVSSMSHAIAQLATNADALNIFAVAKDKHFNYLSSLGITPLSNDGKDWLKKMAGKIDLIVSCDDDMVSIPYKLLKGSGNVISLKSFGRSKCTNTGSKVSMLKTGLNFRGRLSRTPRNRTLSYDVYEQWEKDLDICKRDIRHLLQLLDDKKIEPTILDRISLNKVEDAQDLTRSKRLSGFVVCEPWLVGKSRTICL
jgi:NADPH:quinone reductase-like Zn-dependent oxidoreductase